MVAKEVVSDENIKLPSLPALSIPSLFAVPEIRLCYLLGM